ATTGGFGTAASATTGGFGTAAPATTGGFGTLGGFGSTAVSSAGAVSDGLSGVPDFGRQSALARYLLEMDTAYNALHPDCRFRAFLYNVCTPGQSTLAVARERAVAANAGGGCREEALLRAQAANPDPRRMYPTAVHFLQELRDRAGRQREVLNAMAAHANALAAKAQQFRELDEANAAQARELQLAQVMLQRRWYALLQMTETLRQIGVPPGDEAREARTAAALNAQLTAPGIFKTALAELQPFLDAESAAVASILRSRPGDDSGEMSAIDAPTVTGRSRATTRTTTAAGGGGAAALRTSVKLAASAVGGGGVGGGGSVGLLQQRTDPQLLKTWTHFLERIQQGVEALSELLENDTADMRAIRHRVSSS
ncbi:putative nucleoporin (NUP54/57), partial [Trypanosoma theileri]